jgi:hypothetical protein
MSIVISCPLDLGFFKNYPLSLRANTTYYNVNDSLNKVSGVVILVTFIHSAAIRSVLFGSKNAAGCNASNQYK